MVFVTQLGLAMNVAMSGAKGVVGVLCNSPSLLADAVHSGTDLISDFITLITLSKARKPISAAHPYGQGKWEAIGALSCAALLFGSAGGLCWHSGQQLLENLVRMNVDNPLVNFLAPVLGSGGGGDDELSSTGTAHDDQLPLGWALAVGAGSIACKEWLYQITMRVGVANHSQVVVANAWHHRSDALSSVVVVAGIGGSILFNLPYLDALAGLLVAGMIGKAGYDVGRDSLVSLTDANVDPEIVASLRAAIAGVPDVKGYHRLRARRSGPSYFVDVHIEVDPRLSISAAHQVCHHVERRICESNDRVSEVIVHPDPVDDTPMMALNNDQEQRSASAPSPSWFEEPHHSQDHYPHISRAIVEIETECRELILSEMSDSVRSISHLTVHYLSGALSLQIVFVPVDLSMSIRDSSQISSSMRNLLIQTIPDVDHVEVLLDVDQQ